MQCSNTPKAFSVAITDPEWEQIKALNGPEARYVVKQSSPVEFALATSDVGAVFTPYKGRDKHHHILRTIRRPPVLKNKFWGMIAVKDAQLIRHKIKITPDTSKLHIERMVSERTQKTPIHKESVSLPEFRYAVDTVNRFLTENEGHVVLDIKSGLLKFLVEG